MRTASLCSPNAANGSRTCSASTKQVFEPLLADPAIGNPWARPPSELPGFEGGLPLQRQLDGQRWLDACVGVGGQVLGRILAVSTGRSHRAD